MSIESEIERLQIAKSNLKTAIMGKGVHVDDTDKLDTYYMLVSQIEEGSGGGGIDVSATTVTAGDVLAGKKFYTADGVLTEGTIEEALISGKDDKFGVSITSGYLPEPFEYYAANGTYEITQNTVVLKSGYFKAQTIDVGTRFTETSITPGTENYNIPLGSYIVSPLTIEGDENLIGDNIKSGVTIFGISGRYEGESSGFDTSDATVVSEDLTAGTVAYGKDGKVYGSRIYAEDPMVYFHNGQLKADQPVYLDPENPVTMYTFDGTASPDSIVEGETVYVAGGKVTGSMGHLTVGGMVIQENAILSIPSKSYVEFENYQLRDIAGIGDLASENIAKGKTICGIDGTYEGESSGGSMEIYKCVDADGMTWWVVSGCGSAEANGRYYEDDPIKTDWGETYKAYYQKDGACSLQYPMDSWQLLSGSTVLYRDEGWNYYNGDPSQCTSWVTDSGVAPTPTIAKETTTGNGWNGKKYDEETGAVADVVTELEYKYNPPRIGKFYTADGAIECDVFSGSGLIIYMPMRQLEAVTPQFFSNPYNAVTFTTIQNVYCGHFSGVGAIEATENRLPTNGESRTASLLLYRMTNENTIFLAYGKTTSSLRIFNFACQDNYVRISLWGPDYDFKDIVIDTNIWIHFTIVYTSEYCKIYRNGILSGTLDVTGNDNITDKIFQIGGLNYMDKSPAESSAEVAISELKLYSRELSEAEIKAEAVRCLAMVGSGDSSGNVNWGDGDLNDTGS